MKNQPPLTSSFTNEADDLQYTGLTQIVSSVEYMQNNYDILYKGTNPEIMPGANCMKTWILELQYKFILLLQFKYKRGLSMKPNVTCLQIISNNLQLPCFSRH